MMEEVAIQSDQSEPNKGNRVMVCPTWWGEWVGGTWSWMSRGQCVQRFKGEGRQFTLAKVLTDNRAPVTGLQIRGWDAGASGKEGLTLRDRTKVS